MNPEPNVADRANLTQEDLKKHLKDHKLTPEWLFQIHVIQRRSHLFSVGQDAIEREMRFRLDIAKSIGLTINEVAIVGSAQIGYSIKPGANFRPMDELFKETKRTRDKSDVDVAIVSKSYFEKVHKSLCAFTSDFSKPWEFNNTYATLESMSHFDVPRADYQFLSYFARGWIRPDLCPDAYVFDFSQAVTKWKKALDRKVSIGIYRDWDCLKDYQIKAFENLRFKLIKAAQ